MPTLFIIFIAIMATLVTGLLAGYLSRRAAIRTLVALCICFTYIGLISYFGIVRNNSIRPPGIAFVLFPVILFLIVFILKMRSPAGKRFAMAFPVWLVLGMQLFRVGVELFLHQLWHIGQVPQMLTFAGANVDIYIGATAPLAAWLSTRGKIGPKLALAWNALGLLALANVVVRAVLTTPGPLNFIHAELPNRMIITFPYTFIPAFFVPLAVVLHVLSVRSLIASPDRPIPSAQ